MEDSLRMINGVEVCYLRVDFPRFDHLAELFRKDCDECGPLPAMSYYFLNDPGDIRADHRLTHSQVYHFVCPKYRIKVGVYRIYNPYGELSRSDMISHCENNDQIWYYESSEHFEISPPLTGITPKQFQDLVGTHECSESFVCELEDVRLVGDRAIPQLKDGQFVLEEMGTESMLKSHVLNTFRHSFNNREKIQQILAPMSAKLGDYDIIINMVPRHGASHNKFVNYGHWLSEDLPRLRAYDHYYENTGEKPTLLIKNDSPSWLKDTLRLLGFSSEDWVEWNRKQAVVSHLVMPKLSYIHSTGAQFQPSDRRWVSNQMKSRIDMAEENDFPERVFVSRQGQGRRKIINFNQVMDALREFNFEPVRPEELSIQHQYFTKLVS